MTSQPKTLGELRSSSNWSEQRLANRSLRQELRENLLCRMEKGETLLKPGDVLVQRGTNHSWSVRGDEPCIIAAVLVSAEPVK